MNKPKGKHGHAILQVLPKLLIIKHKESAVCAPFELAFLY
jgi:hypothetical protein